jgi:disulfide bond formation protein DsbB
MVPFLVWAGGMGPLVDILRDNVAFSAASKWIALETTTARVDAAATLAILFDLSPPGAFETIVGVVVIGGAATLLFMRRSAFAYGHFGDAAIVLICLATVIGIYHSFYDLVILVLPAILLTRSDFAGGRPARVLRWATLGTVLFASFNPFKVDTIARLLPGSSRLEEILGVGLTGAALLVAFCLAAVAVWQVPSPVSGHFGTTDSS